MRTALLTLLLAGASPRAERWNVLFIAVDDLRPALGCYADPVAKSPNVDRLAARGVRFERAYCQYPLCNPSRTSLLTGRYPTTSGIMDNLKSFRDAHPDWTTLPGHFRAHGYVTARTGKIFHGGIDDEKSWVEGGEPGQTRPPRPPDQAQRQAQQSDRRVEVEGDGKDQPDFRAATQAVALLEKHRDRPFVIACGFVKPHSPLVAPKAHFDPFDASKIPLPPDFAPRPTAGPGVPEGALPSTNGDLFVRRDATPEEAREMKRAYYACVSWMDSQAGRVLDALDRLGLREKTVVVFFGDHGYHLGEKGKWSKHNSLYEVGTRVPLVIAAPGAAAGKASRRTAELVDLYPTLADLCGLPAPAGVEGQSLAPLLRDPEAAWEHPAYTVTKRAGALGRTVRTERWRYTEWDEEGRKAELYDHESDPHELKNLAADPAAADTIKRLRELIRLPRK